jgi:D-sedoheptulose 7-phosphate isomerase
MTGERPGGPGGPGAGSIESLYPFLYPDSGDAGTTGLSAVLEEVRRSTVAKAEEIMELRRVISARDGDRLMSCAADVAARFTAGGRLLAFGNGGSATDAQELVTLFLNPGFGVRPLPALGLAADISVVTALGNDIGVDVVFARQVAAFGRRRDIAVGLSTSGNSDNLLRAFDEASRRGLLTIGFAGYQGGKMAELDSIDYLFVAPSSSVHRVQEAQTTVYHVLWELTLAALSQTTSLTRTTSLTETTETTVLTETSAATPASASTAATPQDKLDGAEVSR